ncbi:Cap-gly domain-containing linker protein 1-like isoform x3 [Plakobranchus ocellatus]|uniref:Cap-gly domain-containing linker protein 1-like isoform x3 n=1 Tax=Plakobranchus ocellatus TaxID=259542 RepID=A0AAV4AIY4_9GAST|nr:Cap-gly domain-containing linker protein 1-like isoform x3 [Plakobranchus ocellatus]
MDSKHKTLLLQHKPFLSKNIVWSAQFGSLLKAQGLLTEFMLHDIEACETREQKIQTLIDVIPLRGKDSFPKFLDVLQTSGHVFIADFLREDEDNQKVFDAKDMYRCLPFVKRAFNENEKKQIEGYMHEKIEAQVLKLLWRRDDREKDKALEARQQQIEQAYQYEAQFKEKAVVIEKLESEISASVEDREELKAKLAALSAAHRDMEQKHKESLAVQMRYNQANDNAVRRAEQRLAAQESCLRTIKTKLDDCVKVDSRRTLGKVTFEDVKEDNSTKDIDKAKDEFVYLLEDVDLFIRKFKKLLEIRQEYEKLLEERDYILVHFGFKNEIDSNIKANGKKQGGLSNSHDEPSLVEAYKSFAVRNEENINQMKREIEKYGGLLEENKAKMEDMIREKDTKDRKLALGASTWQSAIMSVMRKQLQDLKADARKKETVLQMRDEETVKLKARISELEAQIPRVQKNSLSAHTFHSCNQDLVDSGTRAGMTSAHTPDSVELIPADTPKPSKVRNLPPLKTTYVPPPSKSEHSPRNGATVTLHQVSLIKSRPPPAVVAQTRNFNPDPVRNPSVTTSYPMGPITTQIKPETRQSRPVAMGSVLGDLKAMNKHQGRSGMLTDESRSGFRRSSTGLNKQF